MKKFYLFSLAAVAAGMAFTSCTNNEEVLDQASMRSGLKVSIPATFADNADTRVLKLDGNTLKSEWTKGDKVYVHNNSAFDSNPLVADASGSKVNLEGELAGTYEIGNILTLAYTYKEYIPGRVSGGFEYGTQKGTFEDVQNYDFSVATVEVTAVDGGKVTTTDATFESYQSIFKFTFKNESDEAINVKYLAIKSNNGKVIFGGRPAPTDNDLAGSIEVTLDTPNTEVWVAMRVNESINDLITFEVEGADGKLYSGSKESLPYEKPLNGKYYTSTVSVKQVGEITLKIEPENARTLDGKVYTVTTNGATASGYGKVYGININDGVTLTLGGVTLESGSVGTPASNNTIVLDGENEVAGLNIHPNYGGITFEGTGKLIIKSSEDYSKEYSNIYLKDGLVLTYDAATQTNTIEPKADDEAIVFEDDEVKDACLAEFDINGDGKISFGEAADVIDLGTAFKGNTLIKNFTELRFFTGLTAITESAFEGCTALETITLPNVITSIAAKAFKGATSLKLIVIPPLVTTIGASAFEGCTALKGNRDWEFVFPASVTSIGASAFKNCTSLASFEPHSTTLEIGASAFENAALSSNNVNIKDGELKIGDRAFAGSKLSRINFDAATSPQFGNEVFLGCENLYLISMRSATTPPAFGTDMFKDCTKLGTEVGSTWGIIVPSASVEAYKAADGWKEYKDIIFGQ